MQDRLQRAENLYEKSSLIDLCLGHFKNVSIAIASITTREFVVDYKPQLTGTSNGCNPAKVLEFEAVEIILKTFFAVLASVEEKYREVTFSLR